jgi:hypothetical protein
MPNNDQKQQKKTQRSHSWGGAETQSSSPVTETGQESVTDASGSEQTKKKNSRSNSLLSKIGSGINKALNGLENFVSGSPTTPTFSGANIVKSPTLNENLESSGERSTEQTTSPSNPQETIQEVFVEEGENNDKIETGSDNLAEDTEKNVETDSSLVVDDSHEGENSQPDENKDNSSEAAETSIQESLETEETGEISEIPSDGKKETSRSLEEIAAGAETIIQLIRNVNELNDEGEMELTSPTWNNITFVANENFFNIEIDQEIRNNAELMNKIRQVYQKQIEILREKATHGEAKTDQPAPGKETQIEGDNAALHTADLREPKITVVNELPTTTTGTEIGEETSEPLAPYYYLKRNKRNETTNEDEEVINSLKERLEKLKTNLFIPNSLAWQEKRNSLRNSLSEVSDNWQGYWTAWWHSVEYTIEDYISQRIENENNKRIAWEFFDQIKNETLRELQEFRESGDNLTTEEEERTDTYRGSGTIETKSEDERLYDVPTEDEPRTSERPETPVTPIKKTPEDNSGSGGKIAVAILILVVAGAIVAGVWKWLSNRRKAKISEKTN